MKKMIAIAFVLCAVGIGTGSILGVTIYQAHKLEQTSCEVVNPQETISDLEKCGEQLLKCDAAFEMWRNRAEQASEMLMAVVQDCSNYKQQGD